MERGRHQLLQHAMSWHTLHGWRSTSFAATRDVLTFASWTEVDINCCNRRCSDARHMDKDRHHLLLHATSWRPIHGRRLTWSAATGDVLTHSTWIEVDINCCITWFPDARFMDRGRHHLLQHATSWRPLHELRSTWSAATRDVLTSATLTDVDMKCCKAMFWRTLHGWRSTSFAATRDVLTSATWTEVDMKCCNRRCTDTRYMDRGRHELLLHATSWRPLHERRLTSTAATGDVLMHAAWIEVDNICCYTRRLDVLYMYMGGGWHEVLQQAMYWRMLHG